MNMGRSNSVSEALHSTLPNLRGESKIVSIEHQSYPELKDLSNDGDYGISTFP